MKFTQNISISEKPFHIWFAYLNISILVCGVCDIFLCLFPHISLIYHLLDSTLFSFQGTSRICFLLFQCEFMQIVNFLWFRRVCLIREDEEKFAWCVNSPEIGGDEENRTPDPLLARQVLSQLSYTPRFSLMLRQSCLGIRVYCLRCFSSPEQKFLLLILHLFAKRCSNVILTLSQFCLNCAFARPPHTVVCKEAKMCKSSKIWWA